MNPKTIAFDADDTLWHNEPYFDEAQERFCELFQDYASSQEILGLILSQGMILMTSNAEGKLVFVNPDREGFDNWGVIG